MGECHENMSRSHLTSKIRNFIRNYTNYVYILLKIDIFETIVDLKQ